MADEEADLETIAGLLEDEYARAILRHTSVERLSASALADRCDTSKATAYRRIDRLKEHDLVEAYQELDPDGHHYETFVASFEELTVSLEDGEFHVAVERSTDPADQLTDLLGQLR
ncbi:ArsR/SmtB family transcription factor [Halobaculum sp. MBLA0147]|uniref:ArsR/SmtB family transcription factor n=1 Tax=Halobaculum sp. MBLA0147 TaxID=3079934 RepID=UPI00352492A9